MKYLIFSLVLVVVFVVNIYVVDNSDIEMIIIEYK